MKFHDSALAHTYLDPLVGIEIGGSAHNPYNLPNCINVDYTDNMNTVFKQAEQELCGEKLKVDIVADGCKLPFKDSTYDYVISSHVIEHIFDPIAAIIEWLRVIKTGGYIFTTIPIKEFVPGENRPITKLQELIDRHNNILSKDTVNMLTELNNVDSNTLSKNTINGILADHDTGHFTVFNVKLFKEMVEYIGGNEIITIQDFDDKVGNGFTVLLRKL